MSDNLIRRQLQNYEKAFNLSVKNEIFLQNIVLIAFQMTKREIIKVFEERKVRTVWDDSEEKWYFSIVDVVAVLTDSADPKQYIKRMKSRDESLKANWGTICTLVPLVSEDGKKHKENPQTNNK